MTAPLVLSLQSRVAYGHVGNAAACFILQRLGCEVVDLPTVLLSAHPGHGRPGGGPVPAAQLSDMVDGLERCGILDRIAGVVVGYLGTAETGLLAERLIRRIRAACPGAFVLIDPVIGDRGEGRYVRDGIGEVFRDHLLPLADLVTPNHFELEWLAGRPIASDAEAWAAFDRLGIIDGVVTSFEGAVTLAAWTGFGTLARFAGRCFCAPAARQPGWVPSGLGDSLAAGLTGRLLLGADRPAALAGAVAATEAMIRAAAADGLDELPLIAAQHLLVETPPARLYPITGGVVG